MKGVLEQRTEFTVEVLVGEDGSTDGTREILLGFAEQHPERIKLILRDRKDVLFINGRATGRANFLDLMNRSMGKYIAVCEGDDYWIDPLKLQKQVDILEKDIQAVGCFTDVFNEMGEERTPFFDGVSYRLPPSKVFEKDLVFGIGMPHCSMLYRKTNLFPLPPEIYTAPIADTIIFIHMSSAGHFTYLPEFTAVRSVHRGGIFSMTKSSYKLKVRKSVLPMINSMTHGRYADEIDRKMRNVDLELWRIASDSKDRALMKETWLEVMKDRDAAGWNRKTAARNWLKAYLPFIEDLYSKVQG